MKKFARIRTYDEIVAACKTQGLALGDLLYRRRGDNTITVEGGGCRVYYNTFNGHFFGTAAVLFPSGSVRLLDFDSCSTTYEDAPWFQGLLSFFYVEKP